MDRKRLSALCWLAADRGVWAAVTNACCPLAGRPLLAHVIERLKPQFSELIVNANGDPARFSGFGLPVVADRLGDHARPLAGI